MGYYSALKRNELFTHGSPEWVSEELIMLSAKASPQASPCMLFDFIYITFLAQQDDRNEERVSVCQGLRRGGIKREVGGAIKVLPSLRGGNVLCFDLYQPHHTSCDCTVGCFLFCFVTFFFFNYASHPAWSPMWGHNSEIETWDQDLSPDQESEAYTTEPPRCCSCVSCY